jgi:predicted methyltransferase
MHIQRVISVCLVSLFVTAGCAMKPAATSSAAADKAAIAAAIANPNRLAADVARDAGRKPQAILEFAGARPGMSVLDLFAGGGYYTELLSYVAGPSGRVVAYNNTGYARVAGKDIEAHFANGRLASVEQLTSDNNETRLPAASFDLVMMILSYHDVYYLDGERGWNRIDRPKLLKEVFNSVKPGGKVVVIDHVATAGMPAEQVKALHRIDPALIKADFTAAGFALDGESDVLRNPNDNFGLIAMAPPVRGKTDRAVLRFVKP